jgi:hypothetical protein|tara:strand:- start:1178 stop:1483 length:306 start_codon:yes stop_codon:yes gene_type:complete
MSFATISNWENAPGIDNEQLQLTIRQTYVSAVLGLGASDVYFVQTSATTSTTFTVYPDQAKADAAKKRQDTVRAHVAGELGIKMISDARGNVFASGKVMPL